MIITSEEKSVIEIALLLWIEES